MYIYYCKNCNECEAFDEKNGVHICPGCNRPFLPLKVPAERWNDLSNDEMIGAIERAKSLSKPNMKSKRGFTREKVIVIAAIVVVALGVAGVVLKNQLIDKPLNTTKLWTESYIKDVDSGDTSKDFSTYLDAKFRMIKQNYDELSDSNKQKYDEWLQSEYHLTYNSLSSLRYKSW